MRALRTVMVPKNVALFFPVRQRAESLHSLRRVGVGAETKRNAECG